MNGRFENSIIVIDAAVSKRLIPKEEGEDAIRLLRIVPLDRLNRLARKISHLKDTYHQFWAANEKLQWCTKLLETEAAEMQRLLEVNIEVDVE